jgi:D-alanyl-lipoteichoic acid acyltransferase DltB (MBOAT superfamily)
MQLDSGQFVLFLLLAWAVWRVLPKVAAPGVLLAASAFFYASSNLRHFGLMLLLAGFNYVAVRKLSAWNDCRKRTFLFALAVVFDIGLLVFYKWAYVYLDLHDSPAGLRELLPLSKANTVAFPLGLSFFTFQIVSCVTDVYRRNYLWTTGAGSFFLFAFFFPQISAGPIPRASTLVPQLTKPRSLAPGDLEAGSCLFAYGLFKKLVVADRLKEYVDYVMPKQAQTSSLPVLLACVFSALFLYADFSGYTDMARGAARLFGIHLDYNFDRPFLAESITDLWRRWNMTLSSWLRDYLYMPLVIRLRSFGKAAFVFSFLFTFLVCGLWHGISWPFAVFGLMHGTALSTEMLTRRWRQSWINRLPWLGSPWIGRTYVFSFFVMANVMFGAASVSQALEIYGKILALRLPSGLGELFVNHGLIFFLLVFAALAVWGLVSAVRPKWAEHHCARFVLLCAVSILILGRLAEKGFVYVAF